MPFRAAGAALSAEYNTGILFSHGECLLCHSVKGCRECLCPLRLFLGVCCAFGSASSFPVPLSSVERTEAESGEAKLHKQGRNGHRVHECPSLTGPTYRLSEWRCHSRGTDRSQRSRFRSAAGPSTSENCRVPYLGQSGRSIAVREQVIHDRAADVCRARPEFTLCWDTLFCLFFFHFPASVSFIIDSR